ncbi:MAG: threonine ammonia-lyase [Muribaculaceae bacterium]|nr:threonine ammonia-lyase [Muribaculaceae bacterium]MDE6643167.1 threonine ammonia-lyase [Muribaculaceae bacterium]
MTDKLTIEEVYKAKNVLKDVARNTRLVPTKICEDAEIYLKPECLQHTGSFKLRGAYYKISQLTPAEKERGVIACSAGNHAQGVALGATRNGIKSLICLPAGAPISKVEATKSYGAEVCLVPGVYDDAYAKAIELRDKHGYTFVHPFDDPLVIAGQGTIGLEILEEMPDVEEIVVPIGGGGLISGLAFAVKTLRPDVKIYGVQAEGAPSMAESMKKHSKVHLDSVSTIADGIAVKEPGVNTFDLVSRYVDEVVTVSEDEIAAAILYLIEKQKLVSEGAGAVSVAAVMAGKIPVKGKKVVCLVSGGNIDVNTLNRVITRGLTVGGRLLNLTIDLADKPGQLSGVCNIIAELGGNVVSINHERIGDTNHGINDCIIRVELETRNHEHIKQIKQTLFEKGYKILA